MNKKKIIASILAVLILFIIALRLPKKDSSNAEQPAKQLTKVITKKAADSKTFSQKNQYPATVIGDQEIKITAKSSGTIITAPGNIGDSLRAGSIIAKIDDSGTIGFGDQGYKSLQIQQSDIAAEQARKTYNLAKNIYEDLKDSDSASDSQIDSAKAQRDITKLQYENAALSLSGNVDNHLITTPISGFVTNKAVSLGDSVSVGQLIATVSKSANMKIQFYVDQNEQKSLTRGQEVSATDNNGNITSFTVRNISMSADQITKRFLIEAYPKQANKSLLAGTIMTVSIERLAQPQSNENFILPLSAIGIGQNESYIFTAANNTAKKVIVQVVSVMGETAEISGPISPEENIIIEGNKLIKDGETVELQTN